MSARARWGRIAVGAVVFDVVWGLSVVLAGRGHWAAGAGVAVLGGAAHAWLARADRRLLGRIVGVAAIGTAADLALIAMGVMRFATATPAIAAVVWFAGLWLHFAPSVALLFRWLAGRLWIAGLLGVAGGPLAYWVAERLGAVAMERNWSLLVIAAMWGFLFPMSVRMLTVRSGGGPRRAPSDPGSGASR